MSDTPGFLTRLRHGMVRGQGEIEADELLEESRLSGATPVSECCAGERSEVSGTVRSVTLRPVGEMPAFEAELYDGSGSLHVVWMGRRRILGVNPGSRMSVFGRVTNVGNRPTMFNPRYALRPKAGV